MTERQTPDRHIPTHQPEGWDEVDGDALVPDNTSGPWEYPTSAGHEVYHTDQVGLAPNNGETRSDTEPTEMEKMMIVFGVLGFYPTNTRELSDALAIIDQHSMHGPSGTTQHLNEILQRQQKYNVPKPDAALRSVVRTWILFAKRAIADRTSLITLQEEMKLANSSLEPAVIHANTGIGPYVRAIDLRDYAQGEEEAFLERLYVPKSNNRSFDPYAPTYLQEPYKSHAMYVMGQANVGKVQGNLAEFIKEQESRIRFWVTTLEESLSHLSVRSLVQEELKSIKPQDA